MSGKKVWTRAADAVDRHYRLIVPAAIIAAAAAVYGQTVGFEFVWDDVIVYQRNIPILVRLSKETFLLTFKVFPLGMYTPVMWLFWALVSLAGSAVSGVQQHSPQAFHLANIVLHAANGLLIHAFLASLVRDRRAALAGALLFMVHPVQVQAVAWVSGARDLLSIFFCLCSIVLHCAGRRSAAASGKPSHRHGVSSIAFLVIAVLTKPTAVSLPLLIALLDFLIFHRSIRTVLVRLFISYAFLVPFHLVLMRTEYQPDMPLWSRPFFCMDAINYYFYKILVPLRYAASYGRTPQYLMSQLWFYVEWVVPLFLLYEAWRFRERHPLILFAYLFFVAAFLPMSGLMPFTFLVEWSTVADRWVYLSIAGFSLVLSYGLSLARSRWTWAVALAVIALLGIRSCVIDVPVWRNNFTLWDHCIRVTPDEANAHYNRGMYFLRTGEGKRALQDFDTALRLRPDMYPVYLNRANLYMIMKSYDRALDDYNRAVELRPEEAVTYYNRGNLFRETGRHDRAFDDYNKALELDPRNIDALMNLGILYAVTGRPGQALEAYGRALALEPGNATVLFNRGNLLVQQRRYDQAIESYTMAIQSDPGLAGPYINRAGVYLLLGDHRRALEDYNRALERDPQNAQARAGRAALLKMYPGNGR